MRPSLVPIAEVLAGVALAALLMVIPEAANAADPSPQELQERVDQLEESLRQLRKDTRGLEVREELKLKEKPVAGWSAKDGFFIQSLDGAYKLKVGGYTHFDSRYFVDGQDDGNPSQFTFRRVRPNIEGTVAQYIGFRILPDFAGSSLVLQDAYVDFKYFPFAVLRAGKFKTPYGIERLQSATAITFVERSVADNLVPNRDLGVQLGGEVGLGAFSYALGVFNGVVDGGSTDVDLNDDIDFAARVFYHPFRNTALIALQGVGFGIAGTYGREDGTTATPDVGRFRTSGRQTFFRYVADSPATAAGTVIADGDRYRFSPQAYYYYGPFGALFEYNTTTQELTQGARTAWLTNQGWRVQGSYVLTGENATYRGVMPTQPFDPFKGTWGAFELALRGAGIDVDDQTFEIGFAQKNRSADEAHQFTVGVNWYLNAHVKLVLNYDRTSFDGGAAGGDRHTEDLIVGRTQLLF
jgi:phosphate-selective porin OprO/OprP